MQNTTGNVDAAVTEGDWLTVGTITASAVPFTCSANNATTARTAQVTLSFTGAANKVVTITQAAHPMPSISAENVNIDCDATSGSIVYSVNSAIPGGVVTAATVTSSTPDGWLTVTGSNPFSSPIGFTCPANTANTAKTATVQLTYTFNTNQTVTKDVTVTQAAAPLSTMDAIFAAATSAGKTATDVVVSFDNWVVTGVKSKNAYVTDGTKGFIIYEDGHGFQVGNVLSGTAACKVQLYNGSAEITALKTSTTGLSVATGGTVTPVTNMSIADLSGINTGAVFSFENLSYDGTNLSDGTNEIKPYNNLYNFSLTSGKTYDVTGVYLQYNTNNGNTKEILPRSAADIQEVVVATPTITVSPNSLSGLTYSEGQGPSAVKTVSVSGQNLTGNISLSLGATSSFEMSLSENGEYTNSLSLTQTSGSVAATTVYVRLKAGLSVGASYSGTITLSSTGASNASVSLSGSVTAYVSPIATLPFSFDDGKNAIATTAGITQEGLGSDYSTGPKLKFDSTGDWILLQFDERPGVLSFDIKGNSFDGGTFTVQTSTDGTTFTNLKAYTSFGTNGNDKLSEKFEALDKDVRYIKWVYTNKSTGNVGLDNISLKKYVAPAPKITLNSYSVEATAEATAGSFVVTYTSIDFDKGIDVVWYTDDTEETIVYSSPEWFYLAFTQDSEPGLTYSISANTGEARAAYFKVHGKDAEDNDVYSGLVTVSQAKYVADYATLPFAFDGGRDDIESTSGLTQESLDTDYSSSPKLKFKATGTYMVLKIKERPGVLKFDIKGNSFSDGTFKVQTSTDGTTYTDLKTYTTLGDTQSEEFDNLGADVRYIKWIYTEKVNGNVALGNISLNPYAAEEFALTAAFCDGRYWATFYSSAANYNMPQDVTAYTMDANHHLYQLVVPSEDRPAHMIPAGTAVILIAESSSITLERNLDSDPEIAKVGTEDVTEFNSILTGSNFAIPVVSVTGTPYVLNIKEGVLGFYPLSQDASIPANKAYYIVSE